MPDGQQGVENVPKDEEMTEDKTSESQATEPEQDKMEMLGKALKQMIDEKNKYESLFKELAGAITGKQEKKEPEKATLPEIEALKKDIEALRAAEPLRKELSELKAKLREPASAPRSQAVAPSKSATANKVLTVKEATDFLMKKAKEGTPMSKEDWARLGFRRF